MALLLGVDVGTTNCKAGVFDESGRMVRFCKSGTITHHDADGAAWYDPEQLWQGIAQIIRNATADLAEGERIDAVSVASMGEAGVPVDAHNQPLYPIISWFDPRSMPQADQIERVIGRERAFRITGLDIGPIFSVPKIMWLRSNEPEVFRRTARWLCITDLVYLKLAGVHATDYSIASRTMAFDITRGQWSEEILGPLELDASLFPEPVPAGSLVGCITAEAAGATGLLEGTPVVAGGHDHLCGSLASGILLGRRVFDSSGTSESIHTLVEPGSELLSAQQGFRIGRYVDPRFLYVAGGIVSSGVCVDWALGISGGEMSYRDAMCAAAGAAPGSRGLLFLPHMRGSGAPHWDPRSRGAILGLTPSHTRAEIMRSVIEGLCFEVRIILEAMSELVEDEVDGLTVMGGGASSSFWQQTKADITGLPVEVPDVSEATAMGAAMLAGIGIGVYTDTRNASTRTYRSKHTYQPRSENRLAYDQLYSAYREFYPAVADLSHRLSHVVTSNGCPGPEGV